MIWKHNMDHIVVCFTVEGKTLKIVLKRWGFFLQFWSSPIIVVLVISHRKA